MYDLAVQAAIEVLAADAATLSQFDRAQGIAQVLRNHGRLAPWEQERPLGESYLLGEHPHLGTLLLEGHAWWGPVDDPRLQPGERELLASLGKQTVAMVPVHTGGGVWGGLHVLREDGGTPFVDVDVEVLHTLAALVGGALRHLQDRAVLRDMAYRDPLTGLGNRRAVDERLEAVFTDERLATPVAVVLGDVNGLKEVNDERGHGEGDRLLRETADILTREIARHPRGLAARIGGDEFCLLLEGVTDDEVQQVAMRVMTATATLPTGSGMSCGYAITDRRPGGAPTPGAAARALLRLADAMQYREKRRARALRVDPPLTPPVGVPRQEPRHPARDVGRKLAAAALQALQAAPDDLEVRLGALAVSAATTLGAAAWWVSASDGIALEVRRGEFLRDPDTDHVNEAQGVGDRYLLEDYPASAAVLGGGAFFATIEDGELSEREFLAANRYTAVLGTGVTRDGVGWLVEICADAMTEPLAPHEGLLIALTLLAAGSGPAQALAPRPVSGPSASP
ncbi:MAG: sensor domain-containing diguanylate cyclase [Actinobacteria bacterium]|nr:sensor domain-containing diguanylate cyclase [Actinomycetota bacterium]